MSESNGEYYPTDKLLRKSSGPADPLLWGRPGELTQEEVDVYVKFRDEVESRGGEFRNTVYSFGEIEGEPYALTRWLRARKYVYDLVITMVEEATECRAKAREADFYPDPKVALGTDPHAYISQYPQLYYGFAKNGCPIYISKPGHININAIECLTSIDGILRFHWYAQMHDFGDRLRAHKKSDSNFTKFECLIVMDLENLSVSQLSSRVLAIIKDQAAIDSLCFPETMYKMLIVNAPRFFSATWKVIKGWLDARTANKVEIISSAKTWKKRLLELVDPDQLPSDYGGTGPSSTALILENSSKHDVKRTHTEMLSVRKTASHVFEVAAGETLDITVYTKAKNGAIFSVSTEDKKQVFAEKVDITFKGSSVDNESPETVKLAEGLKGPMKYKVKAEAKSGALSYDNYLLSYSVC